MDIASLAQPAVVAGHTTTGRQDAHHDTHHGARHAASGALLAAALDELDYGVAIVDERAAVLHMNHRAACWFDGGAGVQVREGRLAAAQAQAVDELAQLLRAVDDAASRGLRRMVGFGCGASRCHAAVVPVHTGVAALLLARPRLCEDLSLQSFGRAHSLSGAEVRVLGALGQGKPPTQIAREHGVAVSTVRSQLAAIRDKTGTHSLRSLLHLVAALPPIVSALRH